MAVINGDDGDNDLVGGLGNDTINGFGGDDTLRASIDNDLLIGGSGNDNLIDGFGFDTLLGGSGNDTLSSGRGSNSLDGGTGTDTILLYNFLGGGGPLLVDLQKGLVEHTPMLQDTISGFEIYIGASNKQNQIFGSSRGETIIGGDFAGDVIDGRQGNDSLEGGFGGDTLSGGSGNDTLLGGFGSDTLDGGTGLDWLSYEFGSANLVAILDPRYAIYNSGDILDDTYSGFEGLIGSSNNDFLAGDNGLNGLDGGDGDDQLFGLGGLDYLIGGNGDDTLNGGNGSDWLFGDAGDDWASYKVLGGAVTASLANPGSNSGQAQGDRYFSIENLEGSLRADRLTGDAGSNKLAGLAGADTLNGGGGFDYASYESSASGVTAILLGGYANLTTGHAANDSYTSIEGLIGSNRDDILAGNNGANEILGLAGNDFLIGVNGNDTLDGGVGNDTLNGGLPFNPSGFGRDRFVFKIGYDNDTIDGFAAGAGGEDIIALSLGTSFDEFSEIQGAASDIGGNTLLSFGGGDSLTLIGVASASLHQDDFVFV